MIVLLFKCNSKGHVQVRIKKKPNFKQKSCSFYVTVKPANTES